MAALSADKTTVSRLISSAAKIPGNLIEAIGPAPKAGRDRWIELAARLGLAGAAEKAQAATERAGFAALSSDDRFNRIFTATASKAAPRERPTLWRAEDGSQVVRIKEDDASLTLAIDKQASDAFARYLVDTLPEIYAAFQRGGDKASQP